MRSIARRAEYRIACRTSNALQLRRLPPSRESPFPGALAVALVATLRGSSASSDSGLVEALVAPLLATVAFGITLRCLTVVSLLGITLAVISAVDIIPVVRDAFVPPIPSGVSVPTWWLVAGDGRVV